jgi:hypothetical protein
MNDELVAEVERPEVWKTESQEDWKFFLYGFANPKL